MKKLVLAVIIGCLAIGVSSVACATPPISELTGGESRIWVDYGDQDNSTLHYGWQSRSFEGFQIVTAPTNNFNVFVSHNNFDSAPHMKSSFGTTEGVRYYINPYVRVEAANNDANGDNRFQYGVTAINNIGKNLDASAGITRTDSTTGCSAALIYQVCPRTFMNLSYSYAFNDGLKTKTGELSLGYTF